MTDYSRLEKSRKVRKASFTKEQIKDNLDLGFRDLDIAKKNEGISADWCFSIAYNAMLQAARALMFSKGYRPVGEGQHVTTIEFAGITLGPDFDKTIKAMDRMRTLRNKTVYDRVGLISQKDAERALATAENFLNAISEIFNK